MALGAGVYLQKINDNLKSDTIQDVMNVTIQQRQAYEAFEDFVSGDRERLHSRTEYFSKNGHDEDLQDLLTIFAGVDANFAVVCLEENWIYSSNHGKVMHPEPEDIDAFRTVLAAHETGSIIFSGDGGSSIYTYVPIESIDGGIK